MTKTVSGFVLVGGLAVTAIAFGIASWAANVRSSPSMDMFYDLIKFGGWLGIAAGLGMFFYGSMRFSRK